MQYWHSILSHNSHVTAWAQPLQPALWQRGHAPLMALIANSGYMGTWAAPVILLSKSPAESDEELLWKRRGLMGNHMKGKLELAG